jgi:hypothetical protein
LEKRSKRNRPEKEVHKNIIVPHFERMKTGGGDFFASRVRFSGPARWKDSFFQKILKFPPPK